MHHRRTLRIFRHQALLWPVVLAAITLMSSAAAAEEASVNAQTFIPALGPHSIYTVHTADTLGHLQPAGGLLLNYLSQPVVLTFDDGTREPVVDQQLAAHLVGGMGLWDVAQVDIALPLYLVNDAQFGTNDLSGVTVGDLALRGKYGFLSSQAGPVGVGAVLELTLPTGDGASFAGSSGVTATPMVVADMRVPTGAGPLVLAANLGTRLMQSQEIQDVEVGSKLLYSVGAELHLLNDLLAVGTEIYGGSQYSDFFGKASGSPLEMLLGAKINTGNGFSILAGGGGGLVAGIGAPEFRAFVGLSFAQPVRGEEPEPAYDPCPDIPEDYEGELDEDGCPIEAKAANCDNLIDSWAGLVDEYGCPILDRDGDGVLDEDDLCPDEPGVAENDGCPAIVDRDGDGVPDHEDDCPDEPGLPAYNGCPPPVQMAVREGDQIRILEKVFFEHDKAIIKLASYELLEQVGLIMLTNPDIHRIEIAGHTDVRGDADYNMMLSEERAKSVAQFLVETVGISADRVVAKGYGSMELLEVGDTDAIHARNRRVEFRILEQDAPVEAEKIEEQPAEEQPAEEQPAEPQE